MPTIRAHVEPKDYPKDILGQTIYPGCQVVFDSNHAMKMQLGRVLSVEYFAKTWDTTKREILLIVQHEVKQDWSGKTLKHAKRWQPARVVVVDKLIEMG